MTARAWFYVPLGILLATPAPARAQKYTKKTLDMEKVSMPVPAAVQPKAKAGAKTETKTGPVLTLEQFTAWKQANIQKYIDKQIAQLRQLIALTGPDDAKLPDFWFRLGELYSEKYRYFFNRARSLDEKIFRAKQGEDTSGAEPERRVGS